LQKKEVRNCKGKYVGTLRKQVWVGEVKKTRQETLKPGFSQRKGSVREREEPIRKFRGRSFRARRSASEERDENVCGSAKLLHEGGKLREIRK